MIISGLSPEALKTLTLIKSKRKVQLWPGVEVVNPKPDTEASPDSDLVDRAFEEARPREPVAADQDS